MFVNHRDYGYETTDVNDSVSLPPTNELEKKGDKIDDDTWKRADVWLYDCPVVAAVLAPCITYTYTVIRDTDDSP